MFSSCACKTLAIAGVLACINIVPAAAQPSIRQIPFASWLDAQGTNFFTFFARSGPQSEPPVVGNLVSYEGFGTGAYGHSYGLSVTGSVTARTLDDGTAEVVASIRFSNVITVAYGPGATGKIMGYEPDELGSPDRSPALSSGHLQVTYITSNPSSPVLDLSAVLGGLGVRRIAFSATGSGPLRAAFGVLEGTPGRCVAVQTGLLDIPGGGATGDGFPVEHVEVHVAGGAR